MANPKPFFVIVAAIYVIFLVRPSSCLGKDAPLGLSCYQELWTIAGCSRDGRKYPSNSSSSAEIITLDAMNYT